jgi:hypothetical protein
MINKNKTHAEMIREAVEELRSAKPNSIMDFTVSPNSFEFFDEID